MPTPGSRSHAEADVTEEVHRVRTATTSSTWTVRCPPRGAALTCIYDDTLLRYRVVAGVGHSGALDLLDMDQRAVASLHWLDPRSSDVTILRAGRPSAVVRRAYPDSSVHRWSIGAPDVGELTLYGDVAADKAVLQRGKAIAAEISPLGMQEYDVVIGDAVDHVLVLCVVLATTFVV
jgi:hypothetical protein